MSGIVLHHGETDLLHRLRGFSDLAVCGAGGPADLQVLLVFHLFCFFLSSVLVMQMFASNSDVLMSQNLLSVPRNLVLKANLISLDCEEKKPTLIQQVVIWVWTTADAKSDNTQQAEKSKLITTMLGTTAEIESAIMVGDYNLPGADKTDCGLFAGRDSGHLSVQISSWVHKIMSA